MSLYYVTSEERPLRRLLCRLIGHDMRNEMYGTAAGPCLVAPYCHRCDGSADLFFLPPAKASA